MFVATQLPMRNSIRHLLLALCLATAAAFAAPAASTPAPGRTQAGERTALDRYVAAPDANFTFKLVNTIPGDGCTTYVLAMTSQAWLTTNEVNRPLWQHWLSIVKPDVVTSTTALLTISGGSSDRPAPTKPDGTAMMIATLSKSVVVVLNNIPAQPLVFAGETQGRTEDALIAYSWDKFLRTGDEKWPARLPMTKSAVRAMDAVTAFCASEEGGKVKVDKFFVTGASKRGWTTWTTAAVDERVVAIAPLVIDTLNLEPASKGHFESYGFFARAIGNYTNEHIMDWTGTPQMRRLMRIEDPYEYRARLTMPKFILTAAGDQYFPTDSAQFYFNELPGVKYLRTVPNTDHSMRGSDAMLTLAACYDAVLKGTPLPQFDWKPDGEGTVRVTAKTKPTGVTLWQATNPAARDFRLETIGKVWTSTDLAAEPDGSWVARVVKPAKGWTAYFVELTFPSGTLAPFIFTTIPRVVPDTRPHKWIERTPPATGQ